MVLMMTMMSIEEDVTPHKTDDDHNGHDDDD